MHHQMALYTIYSEISCNEALGGHGDEEEGLPHTAKTLLIYSPYRYGRKVDILKQRISLYWCVKSSWEFAGPCHILKDSPLLPNYKERLLRYIHEVKRNWAQKNSLKISNRESLHLHKLT